MNEKTRNYIFCIVVFLSGFFSGILYNRGTVPVINSISKQLSNTGAAIQTDVRAIESIDRQLEDSTTKLGDTNREFEQLLEDIKKTAK